METKKQACCVFGHRKVAEKEKLKEKLTKIFEHLIACEAVDTFFVGSKSEFDDLCREKEKENHQYFRRNLTY